MTFLASTLIFSATESISHVPVGLIRINTMRLCLIHQQCYTIYKIINGYDNLSFSIKHWVTLCSNCSSKYQWVLVSKPLSEFSAFILGEIFLFLSYMCWNQSKILTWSVSFSLVFSQQSREIRIRWCTFFCSFVLGRKNNILFKWIDFICFIFKTPLVCFPVTLSLLS